MNSEFSGGQLLYIFGKIINLMSVSNTIIRLNDGSGWKIIHDKNATKVFIQCNGVNAQVDVKESSEGQFTTVYNSNLKKIEIESKTNDQNQPIKLVRVNDGTNWGFVYDKKATKVFIQCNGVNAQVDVKESSEGQFVNKHNGNMTQMEIEYGIVEPGPGPGPGPGPAEENIDPKTKNQLAPYQGQVARYSWKTGNQFTRSYGSKCASTGHTGPTIEFELEGQPANGEVIGHMWMPDPLTHCGQTRDDEVTLILKDNHGDGAQDEFQYKIRIPYPKDDGDPLLMKEYKHHDMQEINDVDYKFRPVARGGCTIGMKAVWYDTNDGVMIKFYVDEGEPVKDQSGAEKKNSEGETIRDSWRANPGIHEGHMDKEWDEEESLPETFFQGNPTNNWRLVFEYEDKEKDQAGNPPYKGVTGVQTAFRIDAMGNGQVTSKKHRNRAVLYGGLVREITPPSS
jgi:hypothetical protein